MLHLRGFACAGATCLLLATSVVGAQQRDDKDSKDQDAVRPRVTLRAQPQVSMAPSRVVLTAELTGGANDFEEYYCPSIEWEWGDGTKSEASADCDPYEPGKSEIKRRFTVEHIFRAGQWRVYFRLKKHDKLVGVANATLQVRPGIRDMGMGTP